MKSKSKTPQFKTESPIVAWAKAKSALAKGGTIVITDDDDQDDDIIPSPEIPLPIPPAGTEPGEVLQAVAFSDLSEPELEPMSNIDDDSIDKVVKFESHIEIRGFESPDIPREPKHEYPTKRLRRTSGFLDEKISHAKHTLPREDTSPKAKASAVRDLEKYRHVKRVLLQ